MRKYSTTTGTKTDVLGNSQTGNVVVVTARYAVRVLDIARSLFARLAGRIAADLAVVKADHRLPVARGAAWAPEPMCLGPHRWSLGWRPGRPGSESLAGRF
jgi:hypothetical protein